MNKDMQLQEAIDNNPDLFEELFGIVDGFYDWGKFYILVRDFIGTVKEFEEEHGVDSF